MLNEPPRYSLQGSVFVLVVGLYARLRREAKRSTGARFGNIQSRRWPDGGGAPPRLAGFRVQGSYVFGFSHVVIKASSGLTGFIDLV